MASAHHTLTSFANRKKLHCTKSKLNREKREEQNREKKEMNKPAQ